MRTSTVLRILGVMAAMVLAAAIPAQLAADTPRIHIEPEKGLFKAPVQAFSDPNASGGKCIGTRDGVVEQGKECGGYVKIDFKVETAGTYKLWARCWWLDSCGNSFYAQVDDGPKTVFGEQTTYKEWQWREGPKYTLSAGTHTLYIHGREDGALLDKVIFQDAADRRRPQGKEG